MTNQSISQLAPDAGAAGIFLVVRFAAGIPKRSRQVVAMQDTDRRGARTPHPHSFDRLRPGNPVVKALATKIDWEQGAKHEKGDLLSISQVSCRSATDSATLPDAPSLAQPIHRRSHAIFSAVDRGAGDQHASARLDDQRRGLVIDPAVDLQLAVGAQ